MLLYHSSCYSITLLHVPSAATQIPHSGQDTLDEALLSRGQIERPASVDAHRNGFQSDLPLRIAHANASDGERSEQKRIIIYYE